MTGVNWQPEKLVQHLLFALLGDRSRARVSVSEQGKERSVRVCLDQKGMTRLGGGNGRTAKALHTLLETLGQRHGAPTSLKIELLTAKEESSTTNRRGLQGRLGSGL